MQNKEFEKLIQTFPWDQQQLNFLLAGGIAGAASHVLLGFDLNGIVSIAFLIYLAYLFKTMKLNFFRFYKKQFQVIVQKVTSFRDSSGSIEQDLKQYHYRERQIELYFQLFFIALYFQILGQAAQLFIGSNLGNVLYMITSCVSCYCMIFFTRQSRAGFVRHFGEDDNTKLPLQAKVFQYALVILALIFCQYVSKKVVGYVMPTILVIFLVSISVNGSYAFERYGTTSKKSYAHTLIGALFTFLSDTLYQILVVQQKEISDLLMISSMLYYLSWYLTATGILLHCKAFADFFIIQMRYKYGEIMKKDELATAIQSSSNVDDDTLS